MMGRENELEQALEACLASLRAGRTPEQVLVGYPALRAELEPLLQLALAVPSAATAAPSAAFRAAARARLMATITTSEPPTRPALILSSSKDPARGRARLFPWLTPAPPRWASTFAAGLLAVALLGAFSVSASASALPGDLLYPVKRLAEQAELSLAREAHSRRAVQLRLLDERLNEALVLADRGRGELVAQAAAAYADTLQSVSAEQEAEASEQKADQLAALLAAHQERLERVVERARESSSPAVPALEQALQHSSRGLERAIEVHLEKADRPGPPAERRTADKPTSTPGSGTDRGRSVETSAPKAKDARERELSEKAKESSDTRPEERADGASDGLTEERARGLGEKAPRAVEKSPADKPARPIPSPGLPAAPAQGRDLPEGQAPEGTATAAPRAKPHPAATPGNKADR